MALIEVKNLSKVYGSGEAEVKALKYKFKYRTRRICCNSWTIWIWKKYIVTPNWWSRQT